jgi:hypothetical protein
MHVVAIFCGIHGLAVCGIRSPKVHKKADRKYVLLGLEHVPADAAYKGVHRQTALPGMVRSSQVVQTVLTHDPNAYVVSILWQSGFKCCWLAML